jgi:ribosomal protein S18 acetylase RimI-like enzyme
MSGAPHPAWPDVEIRDLSREQVIANLAALLAIGSDVDGEYWMREHFLRDLPGKWSLSFAAWSGDALLGYAILSARDAASAHLHHFMVGRAHRRLGLGTLMIGEMERRVRASGYGRLTLKVSERNLGAQRLYQRRGYDVARSDGSFLVLEKRLGSPDKQ